eukprot:CAMPEP_0201282116 /NCGR_PEP_ID=MMETSP1317-20130820/4865_1 /ASSEMBLY_ACC=CAM_ASM_000770 /TAXON_ID=187299 /ORGANISM="Undescribed Undescribed, Strain Undescribed" /LENGTH=63 /DNA_ID=CAMNT_0047593945 /DNA_START=85 /DNA_END=276 /DNA_ORIENTATION=-
MYTKASGSRICFEAKVPISDLMGASIKGVMSEANGKAKGNYKKHMVAMKANGVTISSMVLDGN